MKKHILCGAAVALALVVLGYATDDGGSPIMRALIVSDLGNGLATTVARMESLESTVGTMTSLELLKADGQELRTQWDVVWILPDSDADMLRRLSATGGPLESFADAGGVVVMVGVSTSEFRIDVAPRGLDCMNLTDAGATTIADPDHELITGSPLLGTPLTAGDLDPTGTGGGGCLANPPENCNWVSIAVNSSGTILGEYELGDGRVVISLLDLLEQACLDNVLRYVATIAPRNEQ